MTTPNELALAATPATTPVPIVPLNATLAAAADVRRLDIKAMHEKTSGILATIQAGNEALAKKHGVKFYENVHRAYYVLYVLYYISYYIILCIILP